jgi:polycomb group RING finger protein 3
MRGLPCPKDIPPNAGELEEEKAAPDQHAESDYHRQDEQVSQLIILVAAKLNCEK